MYAPKKRFSRHGVQQKPHEDQVMKPAKVPKAHSRYKEPSRNLHGLHVHSFHTPSQTNFPQDHWIPKPLKKNPYLGGSTLGKPMIYVFARQEADEER